MINTSPKIRWAIFAVIALLALLVRLPQLGERPMHTDEAINGYIIGNLLKGGAFHYDPQDRHGPVLYLLAKPIAWFGGARDLPGLTETELRITPVIVGSAMILLFGAAVEMFGFIPCLVAALLFAIGPLPVYYNRYFIHETLFVAATFGLMLCGWRTFKTNSLWTATGTGLCAALMLGCKETAAIHFFALAVAGFSVLAITRFARVPSAKMAAMSFGVFIVATVLLFTWGGRNWTALGDLAHAVSRFTARAGGEGHQKPFDYYFEILDPLFIFSLVALAGIYAALCDAASGTRQSSLLMMFYGIALFLIYSAIPYKTPWLALNLWLPLAFLCGFGVEALWLLDAKGNGRWIVGVGFAVLLIATAEQMKVFCFDKPIDEKNPYAYAHTGEDILRLPGRIEELAKARNLAQPHIAVVMADAWPLPWYLRKFSNTGFWQPGQETGEADFFITPGDVEMKGFRPDIFGLRPNVFISLWRPETNSAAP